RSDSCRRFAGLGGCRWLLPVGDFDVAAVAMPPAVQRRAADAAVWREFRSDLGGDPVEGERFDPGENEGAQLGIRCQPRCPTRALEVALQARLKTPFIKAFKRRIERIEAVANRSACGQGAGQGAWSSAGHRRRFFKACLTDLSVMRSFLAI